MRQIHERSVLHRRETTEKRFLQVLQRVNWQNIAQTEFWQ